MSTSTRTGSRRALPADALKRCPSCGTARGNVRKGWEPIHQDGQVVGYTCADCPAWNEPIRRVDSTRGVRFRAVVDATAAGSTKRKQATKTAATLAEARAWVEQVRSEVATSGGYAPTVGVNVAQVAERYLASRVDIRAVTLDGYRHQLRPVLRRLGDRPISEVTAAEVRELVAWLSEYGAAPTKAKPDGGPLTARSVRSSLGRLSMVLDHAVTDGLVDRNVSKGVKRPRHVKTVGRALEHWQSAELLRFRSVADRHPLAAAWRLTLSGMTRADVMGLRWEDVDMDAGTVTIRQGRVQLISKSGTSVVDAPKSSSRRRTIPVEVIHPGTMALVRALRARQAEDRLRAGNAWHDTGLVVVDALGRPPLPESYSDAFQRLCHQAGVPEIRLHSVRHSLAFWLHQIGVAPADAAALLGHTVEVHLSTYLPDSGSSGIAAAAAALARASIPATA